MGFGPLSSFGAFGSGAGQLNFPWGVTVGPKGTAYVAETENHRVSLFDAEGGFDFAIGEDVRPAGGDTCTATTGCRPGSAFGSSEALSGPVGTALGPEGRLFVSDIGKDRITVYNSVGTFQYGFGSSHLHEPRGIEFDQSGLLHVASSGDNRIDVFTPGGAFIRGIGKDVGPGGADVCTEESSCQPGSADGSAGAMNRPQDVAFGPAGELIVANSGNSRIDVFAADGSFLRAFGKEVNPGSGDKDICTGASGCQAGTPGATAGAFAAPSAIAADAAGNVYVADHSNNRVSVARLDGTFVLAFGEGVIDGASLFQICTATSGCQIGGSGTIPGATSAPSGVAVDCRGAVYVSERASGFARVERFGEPGTAPAPCLAATAAPTGEPDAAKPPSNRFRFAGLVKNRRNGSAVLFVRVPGPGRLILKGRGVRRLVRGAPGAMRVRLPVRPKVRLRHFLKQHGKGRIRVEVTFMPFGGEPMTLEKPIVLKRRRD